MKNINKYRLMILLVVVIISCDDKLNIEPRQFLSSDAVLTNEENLTSVLYGAYSGLKGTFGTNEGGELYGGDFNIVSELMAADSNLVWQGSFSTYREVFNGGINTINAMVAANWIRAYDVINSVNTVLDNLDLAESTESAALLEGQALAIRGMLYFELVRFWSRPYGTGTEGSDPGIPLVLTSTKSVGAADDLATIGRSTVSAVYSQVIDDLTTARDLISEEYMRNGISLSTYAVSAVLSRVYLQQGDFTNALIEADRVIASGLYSLEPNPLGSFNRASNGLEEIFTIQQTSLSNAGTNNGGLATFYARLFGQGRGDMQVQAPFLNSFEAGDLRGGLQEDLGSEATIGSVNEMYYRGVGGQNSGQIQCAKWGDSERNIQIIRLAEMYLTRAEANMELGSSVGDSPLNDVNLIRDRAGLGPLAAVTIDDIRDERVKELAFEGHKLHDYKRWGLLSGDHLVLPIPEREIEVYDIQQNPYYLGE